MTYKFNPDLLSINSMLVAVLMTVISTMILLTSCEGYACGEGVIYDSQTNKPLDSVLCKVLTGDQIQYSDSLGYYKVCNPLSSCVTDCPDIVVEFFKDGYQSKKVKNPKDIYLDR